MDHFLISYLYNLQLVTRRFSLGLFLIPKSHEQNHNLIVKLLKSHKFSVGRVSERVNYQINEVPQSIQYVHRTFTVQSCLSCLFSSFEGLTLINEPAKENNSPIKPNQ